MGEICTEQGRVFLLVEALRTAARDFYLKAPKDEDERRRQDRSFQRDQNTVWYDPDFIEPLRRFVFSRKWCERFRLLESSSHPGDVLTEVRQEIERKGLRSAIMNALNCWDEQREKERKEARLPEYSPVYVKEQLEKLELAQSGFLDLDAEGCAYRDFIGMNTAVLWLNGAYEPEEQRQDNSEDDQPDRISADERCKCFIAKCYENVSAEDKQFYARGKAGRRPEGERTQTGYVSELYQQFKEESPVLVAATVFSKAFHAFKRALRD